MNVYHFERLNKKISFVGPALDEGPLPALIYFALSGQESLQQDPYNQPIAALAHSPIRCFSWDIPHHSLGKDPKEAMEEWREAFIKGEDALSPFIDLSAELVNTLIKEGIINPHKIAVAGLSRGGFLASHLAAKVPQISTLVAFAPLTDLSLFLKQSLAHPLNLAHLAPLLADKKMHLYIGNHDERVDTDSCYRFFRACVTAAIEKIKREAPMEMTIFPSIGYKGHGTPPSIFEAGAYWILKQLQKKAP